MKLFAMHKQTPSMEQGVPPSPQVIEGMGAFIGEMAQKNVFQGGEGLRPSATRARVTASGAVQKGPYAGRHELVAGFCLLTAPTLEEAIGWSGRIAKALGDGVEVEVGPVTEPWDLGAPVPSPKPNPRFLALAKSDAKAETGAPFVSRIAAPIDEMKRAGVLISAEGLAPSVKAKRVRQRQGRQTVLDGPFTESKELIAGFAVLEVASWEEGLSIAERFANVLGGELEMDLRPIG